MEAGRGVFANVYRARMEKTAFLHEDKQLFLEHLRRSIRALIRRAKREGLKPAVRINGTSDLAWLALLMAAEFPEVQFYDYTKHGKAWQRTRANYHLTFSHSENNEAKCMEALAHGINVAVVFDVKRGAPLPETFYGRKVVDGDKHDLRFRDRYRGVIIGLRAKGPAKKDCSGFVVKTAPLVQIQLAA